MAHTRRMLGKQRYMHVPGHPRTHARAGTCTHAHTQISTIYCFSTAIIIHERVSMLHYTYTACFVMVMALPPPPPLDYSVFSVTLKVQTQNNPIQICLCTQKHTSKFDFVVYCTRMYLRLHRVNGRITNK
jgi:hypothetical protein